MPEKRRKLFGGIGVSAALLAAALSCPLWPITAVGGDSRMAEGLGHLVFAGFLIVAGAVASIAENIYASERVPLWRKVYAAIYGFVACLLLGTWVCFLVA